MPAQSKQQQKLFGLALSVKRGDTSRSEVSDDVLGIVDKMSEKEIEDFASTDHKGLPTKKEEIEEIIRERIKEMLNPIMKEGRAFVQAAKKAQQEGKTEFEFNGKTYPITLKEEVITEMSDKEFVGDQLVNGVGDGILSRNEFIKVISKQTNFDKIKLGKVYDVYLKLDGRQRVKLDITRNMDRFLDKLGITESINEVNYTDQTDMKSSVLKNNKVSSLIDFKLWRWAIDNSVKLYKGIGQNYMFTDGIMSLGVNINKPATIVKKWGKVDSKLKQKYIKDIRENRDNTEIKMVNEEMIKIEVDLFKQYNQRKPDRTMPMKVDSKTPLSKLLNHTTFKAMKSKYDYIELHYGDKFLGSAMAGTDNWEFKKGRGLKDTSFRESVNESFADPLEGFPQAYKDLLKKLQRSNDRSERFMLINKMNVIRKKLKLKPLTNESVNEASGEFVTFIEKDNGRKKLLRTSKSQRAANMFMRKHMDNLLNKSGIRSIGTMSKDQWEKKEAMYAENIKKSDMKTVTKKEWDRTHKDYKGMIKGQPYMMWFDKKTQSTVYGPVHIKEDRQLKDPKKEMMVAKKGKVIVIDKKDWNKYKAKGYIVAENKQAEELWSQTIDMLDKNLKKGYDPSKIRNVNLIAGTLQKLFKGLPQRNAMDMATSYNDYKAGQKDKNQTVKDWVRILKKHQIKEASLSVIHKAAKKGSYPVTVMAIDTKKRKVVKQELVKTPMAVPAAFMMMQGGYPEASIEVEDAKGQIIFKEKPIK
jgi:hypothetical protein